jgi:hypothetical protein
MSAAVDVDAGKAICEKVIEQAGRDLLQPPHRVSAHRKLKSEIERLVEIENNRRSALVFFYAATSNFEWMAGGMGLDVDATREVMATALGSQEWAKSDLAGGRSYHEVQRGRRNEVST